MIRTIFSSGLVLLAVGASASAYAQEACLRVVHLSPNTAALDVLANGTELFGDLNFSGYAGYINLSPGSYELNVTLANNPETVLLGTAMRLAANHSYTVAVVGRNADLDVLTLDDVTSPVPPGYAAARILNLAVDAPMADAVTPDGRVVLDDMMGGTATEYLLLREGVYPVEIQNQDGDVMGSQIMVLNEGEVTSGFGAGLYQGDPPVAPLLLVDFPNDCSLNYQTVDYTGMWYDTTQVGQGVQLVQTGSVLEGAWYSYDDTGASTFYTFFGELDGDGNVSSDLLAWSGPAQGADWDEDQVNFTLAGDVSLIFDDTLQRVQLNWSVDAGASGNLTLVPYRPSISQ